MSEIGASLLSAITTAGLPLVGAIFLLNSLGMPLPAALIAMALGALARQHAVDPYATCVVALLSAVAGDMMLFVLGRLSRQWIPQRIENSASMQKIQRYFYRHAFAAIYGTRCLLTSIGPVVSLIAGNAEYPTGLFMAIDLAGQATLILIFGAVGYVFGSQLELLGDIYSGITGLLIGLLLVLLGTYIVVRLWRNRQARTAKP